MSRSGMIVARQYADDLPVFASQSEAERVLLAQRDTGLRELLDEIAEVLDLDYSPRSLNALERWYFEKGQPAVTRSGYSMSRAIAFYFGEVLCRHAQFQWTVEEYVFSKGHFEIGVKRLMLSVMLTKGKNPQSRNNGRMQSLWREFLRYAL